MSVRKPGAPRGIPLVLAVLVLAGCGPLHAMQVNIPNGGRAVSVTIHPSNADRMVVASESGGLFRSTNRGTDWAQVSGSSTFGFTDLLYLPSSPDIVLATAQADMRTVSGGGVWRSTDGGGSWSKAAMTPPTADCTQNLSAYALAVEPTSGRAWAGTSCGVAYSDDQGATWQHLPTAPGYDNDRTLAVLAPAANQLKLLTYAGVKVSTDGGASWSRSNTGLPGYIVKGVHNQLAVSPLNANHLYWAFNHWTWNATTSRWDGNIALYRSTDNGASWSSVVDVGGINRPPFVKVAQSPDGSHYMLYFANGGCSFQRAQVTHGATPSIAPWTALTVDHCDHADLGFDTDRRTPLLLATDGGLHKTTDGGLNWTFTGAAGKGYAALQITEVTGQVGPSGPDTDLYFATQDNDIWASGDNGTTWSARRCCEGFFLNVWREPVADTRLTGVSCAGCGNFTAGPVLAGATNFPNPPNDAGNPRLLKPGYYIQNTAVTGVPASIFNLTPDNGATWAPRYGFPEEVRDLSKTAGSSAAPIVFTAVRRPGSTPDGQELVGIKRIVDVTASGAPILSDVTGFGSLGIFATMFAWYKPFGVDPRAPNHFIVPDIIDDVVKTSTNGGLTWTPDPVLTSLITEGGSLRFRQGPFTQLTTVGFDPVCPGHVLVGTLQAGIFESLDNGASWHKVDGSEVVPNVSTFFFPAEGKAIASSYGRGLWRIDSDCKSIQVPPPILVAEEPVIRWMGVYIPLRQLKNPDTCPVCNWYLMEGGRILDYRVDAQSGRIEEVLISGGALRGFTWEGKAVEAPFRVSTARSAVREETGSFGGDEALAALLREGKVQAKGLLVDKDLPKGIVLAGEDVSVRQLPRREAEVPRIQVDLARAGLGGVPVGTAGPIVIRGQGFAPDVPLDILIDGQKVMLDEPPRPDERGGFTIAISPILGIGGHTLLVRQKAERRTLQEAFTFNVTVQDVPRGEREHP